MLAWWPAKRAMLKRLPVFWLLAASGPIVACMWFAFNAIEDALGLDSVPALLINLAFFAMVGVGLSAAMRFGPRLLASDGESPTPPAEATVERGEQDDKKD